MVIGQEPLSDSVPLRVDVDGNVVTQWEKTRCEDNGLIKMDLLGLKTLTVIENTFRLIEDTTGEKLTIEDIDLNDQDVYKMLGKGGTSGVFQLESSLTPFCIKLKPTTIEDISDINAIGRPSCLPAERKKYAKRRLGREPVTYDHPSLERALKKTYGVLVYEEQALFIAQDCAGWDLNQADALRKISKLKGKDPGLVLKTEAAFVKDCMSHSNMSYEKACLIWTKYIEPLGGYAFNKSHSISYAALCAVTIFLKFNYPKQFFLSLLQMTKHEPDPMDQISRIQKELDLFEIPLLPPHILKSKQDFSIEGDAIRFGLSSIRGVSESTMEKIDNFRNDDGYKDLNKFEVFLTAKEAGINIE